ncbi:MAG: ABC transporter permease subunit [Chloroflexi bacterium]|nr:ABC transporter permease subunit [Chloroflexota bacterium]
MIMHLFATEWRKLTGRALYWAELGVLALLVVGLYTALIVVVQQPASDMPPEALNEIRASLRWPEGVLNALSFANGGEMGGLFAVILAAAMVAQEYRWRTVHLWLSRGVARPMYLTAKAAMLALAQLGFVLTALLLGGLITGIYTWHSTGGLPWDSLPWAALGKGILLTWLTLLPYAALAFALAVVTRSTLAAMGVGVGYSVLIENLAVEVLLLASPQTARVARYLPSLLAKGVLAGLHQSGQVNVGLAVDADVALLNPIHAALLLGLYSLIGFGLALAVFQRQDIPA